MLQFKRKRRKQMEFKVILGNFEIDQKITIFSEINGDTTNMKDDRLDESRHGTNKPLLEIGNRKN